MIARERRKSQKECQEDHGILKQLGGPPWLSFFLSLVLLAFVLGYTEGVRAKEVNARGWFEQSPSLDIFQESF